MSIMKQIIEVYNSVFYNIKKIPKLRLIILMRKIKYYKVIKTEQALRNYASLFLRVAINNMIKKCPSKFPTSVSARRKFIARALKEV